MIYSESIVDLAIVLNFHTIINLNSVNKEGANSLPF